MTLRKKTLLIVGLTLVGLFALLYITIQTVVLNSFVKLEQEQTHQNVTRIRAALLDQLAKLNSTAGAWAPRDDTYAYIQNHDDTYISSNISEDAMANLGLNVVLFFDTSYHIVFSQATDLKSGAVGPIPQSLKVYLANNNFILHHNTPTSSLSGIISLPEAPLFFTSRPIVTSEFQGPIGGTLIMGRYLDNHTITQMSYTAGLPLAVYPVDDPQAPPDVTLAQAALTQESQTFVYPLNQDFIAGYLLLKDVYEKPIYVLKIATPRQIYQQGQTTISFFILLLLVTFLIFGLMTLLLLEREVLSRLTHLNRSVSRIGQRGDLSERIVIFGQDELASLAGEINQMLTALGQSEQSLRDSEQRFRQVISSVSDHIYMTSLKPGGVSYFSPNVERITGYPANQFGVGWNFWESLIYPGDKMIFAQHKTNFRQGQNSEAEYRLVNAHDNIIWVRDSGRVETDSAGMVSAVYGVVSDITERKHAEVLLEQYRTHLETQVSNRTTELITLNEQLLQEIAERKQAEEFLKQARDQALEASRLKTELLAKVSHELRTPLSVILGFTEMLEAGIYGSLSDEQQEPTATIIQSTRYLSELVNELLDQAQLEAGRLKLTIGSFTPTDIIEDMHSKMMVLAQAKNITLTTQIAADVPATLRGDSARVKQILINLVSNAIKFTKQGMVQICLNCPDTNHWAMQVSDTGIGIPTEAQSYIFEPFRQVDGSATREQTGTGLGLSIVKQLAQLMGGEIIVKSEVGQGTIFTVILPLELAVE